MAECTGGDQNLKTTGMRPPGRENSSSISSNGLRIFGRSVFIRLYVRIVTCDTVPVKSLDAPTH